MVGAGQSPSRAKGTVSGPETGMGSNMGLAEWHMSQLQQPDFAGSAGFPSASSQMVSAPTSAQITMGINPADPAALVAENTPKKPKESASRRFVN